MKINWLDTLPTDPLPLYKWGVAEPADWIVGVFKDGVLVSFDALATQRELPFYLTAEAGGHDFKFCKVSDIISCIGTVEANDTAALKSDFVFAMKAINGTAQAISEACNNSIERYQNE